MNTKSPAVKRIGIAIGIMGFLVGVCASDAQTGMVSGTIVAHEQAANDFAKATLEGDLFTYNRSCFTIGYDWSCPTSDIPADKVAADAPERSMKISNDLIVLTFPGVEAHAGYDLQLSFLSNNDDRVEQISAGSTVLEAHLPLPKAQIFKPHWAIPDSACADGTLVVRIKKLSRSMVVLSAATLRARDAGAQLIQNPRITMRLPRISPWPAVVAGVKEPRLDLGGAWRFSVAPTAKFAKASTEPTGTEWSDIQVPGQWLQQGYTVKSNMAGNYCRAFTVPADWTGKRIRLRCDAVYSDATVWVNGRNLGRHLGGFTPFEMDVTDAVKPGKEATIILAVTSEGEADKLASGMMYASHDLGGISRKIQLMALPAVNLASIHVCTTFDSEFKNSTLEVSARVANDGKTASPPSKVNLALSEPQGKVVPIKPASIDVPALEPGQTMEKTISIPITLPQQWDPEHPRLYTLTSTISSGDALETVSTRVGFRQVEVRGNQMFVNGHTVKLHGVCRHEIDPLRGRSLAGNEWDKDAEMFAHANVNFVRTSHYPPAEEFLDACDKIGIFVESEPPVCWPVDGRESTSLLLGETMQMVEFNRNHPSVIIWSLGNESLRAPPFDVSAQMVGMLDPSRPRIFSYGDADLGSSHYPGSASIAKDHNAKPVLCDEYCHINAYNRREQIADPGLRDIWGTDLSGMWETMRSNAGCLGGSIWAGIDDTFVLPGNRTVGYGTWGIIDEWRRPKPEYWHVTKVFSPVRILDEKIDAPAIGQPIRLTVDNRSDFADLSEMHFAWKLAGQSGVGAAKAAPGQKGTLEIPVKAADLADKDLEIRVTNPRGFLVDACRFTIGGQSVSVPSPLRPASTLKLAQDARTITVTGKGFSYVIDAVTGKLTHATASGHELPIAGPYSTLVPHDTTGGGTQLTGTEPTFAPLWGLCTEWKASSVAATQSEQHVSINISGTYAEAGGAYKLSIDGSGRMRVAWNFKVKNEINPRQTGVTFILPKSCETLSWKRRGQWSDYPDDHIGRPAGTAKAFPGHPACGMTGPRTRPTWSWSEDQNQYGSNDFRSTKVNILEALLSDESGIGLRTVAAADRHAHAWIDGDHAMLMIADYANEGSEGFAQATRIIPDRKIVAGGTVEGSVQIEAQGPPGKTRNSASP